MTIKHTPTPWICHGLEITGTNDKRKNFAHGVCTVDNDDDRQGNGVSRANAALIVRAVNAHDELVKALRKVEGHFENFEMSGELGGDEKDCLDAIRAALAKAQGDE